jgi:hypothetical protein
MLQYELRKKHHLRKESWKRNCAAQAFVDIVLNLLAPVKYRIS